MGCLGKVCLTKKLGGTIERKMQKTCLEQESHDASFVVRKETMPTDCVEFTQLITHYCVISFVWRQKLHKEKGNIDFEIGGKQ